jgi:L-ascorbate metabolism protein UlaG (beta-lactamase superfamily)
MNDTLRTTLVANAGVLLAYNGVTLLLDGIFGKEGHPFSHLSEETWEDMLSGRAPFEQIDYLLFTHNHPDHLDCGMVRTFLQRRRVKGVFLPDTHAVRQSGLLEDLVELDIPAVLLSEQTDHAVYRIEPQISVRAFRTRHLDRKFERVHHFCYLLTLGGKRVLFTADMDYVSEDLSELAGLPLHAVFINPLFFSVLRAHRFFKGKLHTRQICVYHVPFSGDDRSGMRSHLAYNLARWGADMPPAWALTEPFQRLDL